MANNNLFLVSFILDNQPQTSEVTSENDTLTVEQARSIIEAQHASGKITDIQVQEMQHPKEHNTSPGHNKL